MSTISRLNLEAAISAVGGVLLEWGDVNFAYNQTGHICGLVGRLPSYRKLGIPELGTSDIIAGVGVCSLHSRGIVS